MLTTQDHQDALLQADNRIVLSSIVAGHIIVPDSDIEERAELLGLLETFQMAMVQQVPAALHVDYDIIGLWQVLVGEVDDSPACGQELLFGNNGDALRRFTTLLRTGRLAEQLLFGYRQELAS